jgi:hypothetical protein
MRGNAYNGECSADLVLRLTSPVQGVIEAGLIGYFSHPALYRYMSGNRCRMEAVTYQNALVLVLVSTEAHLRLGVDDLLWSRDGGVVSGRWHNVCLSE